MEEINYKIPNNNLLTKSNIKNEIDFSIEKEKIKKFFQNYKIDIDCKDVYIGINSITYVIDLKCKTKVSTIKSYKEDLMLIFNARDIQFQVAINGTSYLGIHLIREKDNVLMLGDLVESKEFIENNQKIPIIIGKDFSGKIVIEYLTKLPHLLVAGTTGTGKSKFLSTFIIDIMYKLRLDEVKIILVDTRATNFLRFNGIPHLLIPVITESNKTMGMLAFLIQEMSNRYELFQEKKVDNIDVYNKISEQRLPRIVVIIEDFCDLMMETNKEIEEYIARLIQMSRAAGIHIIISTQRPSTNVITGIIKANIPSKIAFKVPSQVDSKTIIDVAGAEELLMYGDIIFSKLGNYKNKRIQTPYVSDGEIQKIVEFFRTDSNVSYNKDILESIDNPSKLDNKLKVEIEEYDDIDPLLMEVIEYSIQTGQVAIPFIQRRFKIGYAKSGRIIDQMEERGIISGYQGSKPREVLITLEEWNKLRSRIEN